MDLDISHRADLEREFSSLPRLECGADDGVSARFECGNLCKRTTPSILPAFNNDVPRRDAGDSFTASPYQFNMDIQLDIGTL